MREELLKFLKKPFEGIFLSLIKNSSIVAGGNIIAAMLGLVSLAITTRALPPEEFGILVVIQSYVLIIDYLVNFKPHLALIKYGAISLENNDAKDFKSLVKFCFLLDFVSALSGTIIGISLAYFVGLFLQWDQQTVKMAMLYCIVILSHMIGTPTGILRLFDKFHYFAYQVILGSLVKLILVTILYLKSASFQGFLIVWIASEIFANIILLIMGYRELYRQDYRHILRAPVKGIPQKYKNIWGFVWTTNLNDIVLKLIMQLDILIISYFMGSANAGFYRIIKSIGGIFNKINDPLRSVLFPIIVKMELRKEKKELKTFLMQFMSIVIILGLVIYMSFYMLGEYFLIIIFGSNYVSLYREIMLYLLGAVIGMWAIPITPLFLSRGWHKILFIIYQSSSLIYLFFILISSIKNSLIAVSLAFPVFYLNFVFLAFWVFFIKKHELN